MENVITDEEDATSSEEEEEEETWPEFPLNKRIKRCYNDVAYKETRMLLYCDWGNVIAKDIFLFEKEQKRVLQKLYPEELHNTFDLIDYPRTLKKRLGEIGGGGAIKHFTITKKRFCITYYGGLEIGLQEKCDNVAYLLNTSPDDDNTKSLIVFFRWLNDHLFHLENYMLLSLIKHKGLPIDVAKAIHFYF
jgi:hypothetical protein